MKLRIPKPTIHEGRKHWRIPSFSVCRSLQADGLLASLGAWRKAKRLLIAHGVCDYFLFFLYFFGSLVLDS
jgi:hypothetical protein